MPIKKPLVSVILPVKNGEKYLRKSIDSILSQTHRNIELWVINDGSTDSTDKIIKSYTDPRIRYVVHKKSLGLDATLNQAFKRARGVYVARMDADDISLLTRIEKQVAFLEKHPEYGMVGTLYANMDKNRRIYEIGGQLIDYEEIRLGIACVNSFCHGSVMFRTSFLRKNHIRYNHAYAPYEDYELWTRLVHLTKVANIPEVLYLYMNNPDGMFLTQQFAMETGAARLGKRIQSRMSLPPLTLSEVHRLLSRASVYRMPSLPVYGAVFPSNLMLAYQTYLYKMGSVYLRRMNPGGVALLVMSFLLSPKQWFLKAWHNFITL